MVSVCSLSYPAGKANGSILLWPVTNWVVPYFSILSHKRHDFQGNKDYWTWNVCWLSLQMFSNLFLTLRWIQPDTTIKVQRSSCKVPLILVRLQCNFNFLNIFSESAKISNFVKIRPVGAELCTTWACGLEDGSYCFAVLRLRIKRAVMYEAKENSFEQCWCLTYCRHPSFCMLNNWDITSQKCCSWPHLSNGLQTYKR